MNRRTPKEFAIRPLRECPVERIKMDTPDEAVAYWRQHVEKHPYFSREVECFVVLLVNVRRRLLGHHLVAVGSLDCVHVHPREVFRAAIIGAASGIILTHNHPSGNPMPSEADIKVTRGLIRAGQLLKIDVLDHIIMGDDASEVQAGYVSLRNVGYFYSWPKVRLFEVETRIRNHPIRSGVVSPYCVPSNLLINQTCINRLVLPLLRTMKTSCT